MHKRGLSHIEFVVSFVIFIGFIVFAFVFFNPLQSQRTLKSTMDYAWIEVSEKGKESIESYSVSIGSFNTLSFRILIDGVPLAYNASVEDIRGNILATHRDSSGIVYFTRNSINDRFFKIRYASSFNDGPVISATTDLTNGYGISSSEIKDIYFESSFLELNESYYSDYIALKQDLNLPNRVEFGFIVDFNNSQIRAMRDVPDGIEVLSKKDRVEIIRTNGVSEFAEVIVLVW